MAAATSDGDGFITLEFHGALADRFASLGQRRGTRTLVSVPLPDTPTVSTLLTDLANTDARYAHIFDAANGSLPEHVEAVLNDRVLDLQGGLSARLHPGDVLSLLPAHAGG